ncbi:MAG: hypothetical protein AAGN35_07360 [Bacteroidota bacterium]
MPNHYDKLFRELVSGILPRFSRLHLGFSISEATDITLKLQRTCEREPDLVKRIRTSDGEEFILHLEFQTNNDARMIFRMQVYHALLVERFRLPVRHFVLYVGNAPATMRTQLHPAEVMTGYRLIDISQVKSEYFLTSKNAAEVIFAILGDYEGQNEIEILGKIGAQLVTCTNSGLEREKLLEQLRGIAQIRSLNEEVIKKGLKQMPVKIDMTNDPWFKEGERKGKTSIVQSLLRDGTLSLVKISAITGFSEQEISEIKGELST